MKRIFLVLLLFIFQIYTAFSQTNEKNNLIDQQLKKFEWLKYRNTDGSCSSRIIDEKVIYIDPIDITDEISKIKADIILITHEHSEHFEFNSIVKLLKPSTVILTNANVYKVLKNAGYGKVKPKLIIMKNNDTYGSGGFKVQAVPAYNDGFHSKDQNGLGFIITSKNGIRTYISGDTTYIPEMKEFKDISIAVFFIRGGTNLSPETAVSAINAMKPLYVIPVHWREYDIDDIELLKKNLPSGSNIIILNPNK